MVSIRSNLDLIATTSLSKFPFVMNKKVGARLFLPSVPGLTGNSHIYPADLRGQTIAF
jgi:hypothetical protein